MAFAINVLKLNVDGAFLPSLNFEECVGVVWNDKDEFLPSFVYRKNDVASPLQIELLVIRDGIDFLHSLEVTIAVLHSHFLLAVTGLRGSVSPRQSY